MDFQITSRGFCWSSVFLLKCMFYYDSKPGEESIQIYDNILKLKALSG